MLLRDVKVLDINHDRTIRPQIRQRHNYYFRCRNFAASAIGGELAIIGMLWSEYTTEDVSSSQYRNFDSYNVASTDLSTDYNQLYTGALNDLELILQKAKASGDWNFYLMATVLKVYSYQVLVDLYDQVPYTDALQGATNLQPKFDNGQDIYVSLLAKLDSALSQDFSATTVTNPGAADYFFGGDMSKWMAFANTLKLKMFLRMVNTKPADAKQASKHSMTRMLNFCQKTLPLPNGPLRQTNRIRFMRRIYMR